MTTAEKLLNGCWDMHLHGDPSVAPRQDTVETIKEMSKYGYKGFMLKEHYLPTACSAILFNRFLEEYNVEVLSSIILNNAVGGINMYAVDAAYNVGTRIVSLPTISAQRHIEYVSNKFFAGKGKMVYKEADRPIYILDEQGKLKGEVRELIEYAAEHPDMILYTGHVSAKEAEVFLEESVKRGVKNLYANHPHWEVGATMDQMKYWADMGAFIEINQSVFTELATNAEVHIEVIGQMMEALPIEQLIAVSDLGQITNIKPVPGMIGFIECMMDNFGVTEDMITQMIKTNPEKLLNRQE